jgi:hypothetical protein
MTRLSDGRIVAYRTTYGGFTPALYQVDPETGTAGVLVQSAAGAGEVVALTTMPDGNLFARDNSLGFIRINPATLAWSPVNITGPYSAANMYSGGMATSPTGQIYAWCDGFATPAALRSPSKTSRTSSPAYTPTAPNSSASWRSTRTVPGRWVVETVDSMRRGRSRRHRKQGKSDGSPSAGRAVQDKVRGPARRRPL